MENINIEYDSSQSEGQVRSEIFTQLLERYGRGRSLLDMGTGPGWAAIIAQQKGYEVTAVDGRATRVPFQVPNIKWLVCDIMEFDVGGYDTLVNLGLLYHLTLQEQLELLKKCAYTTMIVDTQAIYGTRLNVISEGEYEGRYFHEANAVEELEDLPKASLKNTRSFWPTIESFEKMVLEAGWSKLVAVEKLYGPHRNFFVLLK